MDVTNEDPWESRHAPEPEPEYRRPTGTRLEIEYVTPEMLAGIDLRKWADLAGWLSGGSAYQDSVPVEWRRMVYKGGNSTGAEMARQRRIVGVIFYSQGWGWRARRDWKERIIALAHIQKPRDPRAPGGIGYDGGPGPGPGE